MVEFQEEARNFSFLQEVQTRWGAHAASFSSNAGGFSGGRIKL